MKNNCQKADSDQTILYILTAVRALRNRRLLKDAPVLKRLLRE